MRRYLLLTAFLMTTFLQTLYAQKVDKRISYLKKKYHHMKSYSETGTYKNTGKTMQGEEKLLSEGSHTLFFDNVNKKLRIDAKIIDYNLYNNKVETTPYNFLIAYDDTKDNIFLPIEKMTSKQENILTTLKRHAYSFYLLNPVNSFRKNIFDDTITVKVEEEKLGQIPCYKLTRNYIQAYHKRVFEMLEEDKKICDSLHIPFDIEAARPISNGFPVEERYWFRKSDGALIKSIDISKMYSQATEEYILKSEYIFDPKINPVLPKDIFDKK